MIAGIFHSGSGLGNQLHRYIATRVLATDKGAPFSMVASENFKGSSFMSLDMGKKLDIPYHTESPSGKVIGLPEEVSLSMGYWEEKTPYYNPEFSFIEDNTIIDGEFQDERYFEHRIDEVNEWLKVKPLNTHDNICYIGFRGGEYALFPELFLPKEYWQEAMSIMKKLMPWISFEVHTDDPELAEQFFPGCKCIHDIGKNWRMLRYAKYSIIANSSFYIFPRLLKHHDNQNAITIAPRFWARRNTREWSMPQNFYKKFSYI